MKLMIMGHGDHGKDEAARIICDLLGLSYLGSSWAACEAYIFDSLKVPLGYRSAAECYEDRRSWRTLWGELMAAYNAKDRARLGRYVYDRADVYVGVRRVEEFEAIKAAGLFDVAIWVDASDRKPPEPRASCTVGPELADLVLDNNGTLADLRARCWELSGRFIEK